MLERMGLAPNGRVTPADRITPTSRAPTLTPAKTRNKDLIYKPPAESVGRSQERIAPERMSRISLGFFTGASQMGRSPSKSKLIPSRYNAVLTDYRTRGIKSKSSQRYRAEEVLYNDENRSQHSLNLPSINQSRQQIAWVPSGNHSQTRIFHHNYLNKK